MSLPGPLVGMVCRGCGRPGVEHVLDLGNVAASDYFPPVGTPGEDPAWPLTWVLCPECLLVQLGPVTGVVPEPPTALESATSKQHAAASAAIVVEMLALHRGNTVIEIDSHHGGSWLDGFISQGLVPQPDTGSADLVVDVHGIAHSEQLATPLAAHRARLVPGGRLVMEFHHLLPLIEQVQIDTIRHGHWVYLSALAVQRLLARNGMVLTGVRAVDIFGGSLWIFAQRADDNPSVDPAVAQLLRAERAAGLDSAAALAQFGTKGLAAAAAFAEHLREQHRAGRTVAGYGAPSKAPVLLTLAGVGPELLPYTVDLSPAKHGCRLPGVGVAIEPISRLLTDRPDEVVVLTWDIADEVIAQLRPSLAVTDWDPDFYVPLPEPRYLAGPRSRG